MMAKIKVYATSLWDPFGAMGPDRSYLAMAAWLGCVYGVLGLGIACQSYSTQQLLDTAFVSSVGHTPVTLIAPTNTAVADPAILFIWSANPSALSYEFQFARNPDMSSLVLTSKNYGTNYQLRSTDAINNANVTDDIYYWRIITQYPGKKETSATYSVVLVDKDVVYVNGASAVAVERGNKSAPFKSIQAAMDFASVNRRSQVFVAAGTYNETVQIPADVMLMGGYNANGGWTRDITANVTRLRNSTNESNVLCTRDGTATMGIDGFTIENMKTSGNSYGILCRNAAMTIQNNTISRNTGTGTYTAIYGEFASFQIKANNINALISGTNVGISAYGPSTINVTDNTITIGPSGATSKGITLSNDAALPVYTVTTSRNSIIASAGSATFYGIEATNLTAVQIDRTRIEASSRTGGTVIGVYANSGNITFTNSMINLGGTAAVTTYGILATLGGAIVALNNTINAGNQAELLAVGIRPSSNSSTVRNNIIFASGTATTRQCITESGTITPNAIENNDLFGCPTPYVDDGVNITNLTTAITAGGGGTLVAFGNVSIDNAGNQLFVDIDGSDNNIATFSDNDWRLTSATAPTCNVNAGGLNLSTTISADFVGIPRTVAGIPGCNPTNAGAANWSIGAYERD